MSQGVVFKIFDLCPIYLDFSCLSEECNKYFIQNTVLDAVNHKIVKKSMKDLKFFLEILT